MPELPEVETLRLQLTGLLEGQRIKKIEILKKKSFVGKPKSVIGTKITGVRRFAKLLIFDLDNGLVIVVHLKLTGQLIFRSENIESRIKNKEIILTDPLLERLPNKHTRAVIHFQSNDRLFFNDLRIFGWLRIARNETMKQCNRAIMKLPTVVSLTQNLGPEPFRNLTLGKFREILASSKRPVKIILMDQEKIAGAGNIYANEALFLAKVHPETSANKIPEKQTEVLYHKLLKVLADSIKWKGASKDNYRDAFGQMGKAHEHFFVYGKKGEDCSNKCGGKIQRIALGGRGTFYCPKCQK